MNPSIRRALPAIGVTLGVLALCSIPGASLPRVRLLTADKLAHIVMFALLAWVWLRAFPQQALWIFGGGVAFAGFTEVWQDTLPIGRTGDPADAVADVIGLALVGGAWYVQRLRNASQGKTQA